MLKLLIATSLMLAVAACGGAPTPTPSTAARTQPPVSTPSVPTTEPTKAPWPAKFQTNVCLAMTQFTIIGDDFNDLSAASSDLDIDRVSTLAFAIKVSLQTARSALNAAGRWKPADTFMARVKKATATMISALRDVDRGASRRNIDLIERGSKRMLTAGRQFDRATNALINLRSKTGFSCP